MVKYRSDRIYNAIVNIVLIVIGLICFFPMLYVLLISVTPYEEYLREGGIVFIPRTLTFAAYKMFWNEPYMAVNFLNTIWITLVGCILDIMITVFMAYSLAKKDLICGKFFTFFCLIPMMITGGIVPTYLVVKNTGMIDSLWSLIIPTLISPYVLLITRTFFSQIDAGLYESARIDGAREFRILFSIILPVSTPILATIGLMYGVGQWNSYFPTLMYISSPTKKTIQVVLRGMLARAQSMEVDAEAPTRTLQMAGVIITALPVILVYPFLQKHFTQGIMLGSIKG